MSTLMKEVYVVLCRQQYESTWVEGVFDNKPAANACVDYMSQHHGRNKYDERLFYWVTAQDLETTFQKPEVGK